MLGFTESFLPWLAATAIPAFLGVLMIASAGRRLVRGKYLAAFALGIFLWFFIDTIGGSGNLTVNSGFRGGVVQVAIVALFVIGAVFFFGVEPDGAFSTQTAMGKHGLAIPLLVAVAVGIHGFGEGTAFGATVISTQSTSLLNAFGGVSAGVSYVLHKLLEPMMVGACYVVYPREQAKSVVGRTGDALLLSLIFAIPSLIGAATGYYLTYDSTYFFALGTGTSVYAAIRLARPLFDTVNGKSSGSKDSARVVVSLILGFLAIYFAALFHS